MTAMPADPRDQLRWALQELNEERGLGLPAGEIRILSERLAAALSAQPSGEGERGRMIRDGRMVMDAYEISARCRYCGMEGGLHVEICKNKGIGFPIALLAAPTSPPASAAPADGGEALREFEERVRTHVRVEMLAKLGMETQENVAGWVALVDEARAVLSRSPA